MTKAKKAGVVIAALFAAFAVGAAVYFFLPTAPKTIEGARVSEDGLVVATHEGGTGRIRTTNHPKLFWWLPVRT